MTWWCILPRSHFAPFMINTDTSWIIDTRNIKLCQLSLCCSTVFGRPHSKDDLRAYLILLQVMVHDWSVLENFLYVRKYQNQVCVCVHACAWGCVCVFVCAYQCVGACTCIHLYYYYWSLLYSAILRSRADSLRSHVILHEWIAFYSAFLNIHRSGVLTALAWLVPQESAARESQSWRVLCTPYNHAPCHFMQSHIRKVYACLAVTCHLRFWQNDRGLLRATAVTRGWNGYRNKSQHRKLTLEKKILPPLQQGFEPATFRSRVLCSNHWAIPAPPTNLCMCVLFCTADTPVIPLNYQNISLSCSCSAASWFKMLLRSEWRWQLVQIMAS